MQRSKLPYGLRELREGEYPSKIYAVNGEGEPVVMDTIKRVPKSERPTPPIQDRALGEFLSNLFDGLNFKGRTGIGALIHLCQMGAWRYDNLKRFIVAWDDLHQPNIYRELFPGSALAPPTLDQACDIAKVSPEDFVGDIYRMVYYYGGEAARIQIQLGMTEVVQAAQTTAKMTGKEGFQDRKLLFEATKLVESGPQVVNNINNQLSTTNVVGLPKWEDSDKMLMDALVAPRALPAATDIQTVEVESVEQPVEVAK